MTAEPHARLRRRWWVWAWLVLFTGTFAVHSLAWVPGDRFNAGLSGPAELPGMKSASNAQDLFLGPFWIALEVLTRDWGVYDTLRSAASCAAGSALVIGFVRLLAGARRWLAARRPAGPTGVDVVRRRILIESPLAAGALMVGGVSALGAGVEPYQLKVRRHRVPIADLPDSLDGLRLVLIADTHLGPRVPAAFIEHAVARAMALRPDVMLLGGDYIHAGTRYIDPAVKLFKPILDAGIPTVGVLGNHDWYSARGLISLRLRDLGVHMVDNRHVFLDAGTRKVTSQTPEAGLCIAGVGDFLCDVVDLDGAIAGVPASMPRLVLSHNPDAAELPTVCGGAKRNRRVDLMLCGHTHGGQIRFPIVGPLLVPSDHGAKYEGGLVQGPSFPVLISRGVGMSICPIRLGVPPELVEVTLVRA